MGREKKNNLSRPDQLGRDQDSLDGLYSSSGLGIQEELERVCWGEG